MVHYICTGGCGGTSETPGVCNAEGCPKYHEPLAECKCTDGRHHAEEKKEHSGTDEGASL